MTLTTIDCSDDDGAPSTIYGGEVGDSFVFFNSFVGNFSSIVFYFVAHSSPIGRLLHFDGFPSKSKTIACVLYDDNIFLATPRYHYYHCTLARIPPSHSRCFVRHLVRRHHSQRRLPGPLPSSPLRLAFSAPFVLLGLTLLYILRNVEAFFGGRLLKWGNLQWYRSLGQIQLGPFAASKE
jgi:hypothetical protein